MSTAIFHASPCSGGQDPLPQPRWLPIALGFQIMSIWDCIKLLRSLLPLLAVPPQWPLGPSGQPKCQIVKEVHIEAAKEFEGIAANLLHNALQCTAFWHTTNLMIKLVPILTNCMPSLNQDIIYCTITKQVLCLAKFEYLSNPYIDILDIPSPALKNNSLHSLVLAYCYYQHISFLVQSLLMRKVYLCEKDM